MTNTILIILFSVFLLWLACDFQEKQIPTQCEQNGVRLSLVGPLPFEKSLCPEISRAPSKNKRGVWLRLFCVEDLPE
jgi:hypothetical protein